MIKYVAERICYNMFQKTVRRIFSVISATAYSMKDILSDKKKTGFDEAPSSQSSFSSNSVAASQATSLVLEQTAPSPDASAGLTGSEGGILLADFSFSDCIFTF